MAHKLTKLQTEKLLIGSRTASSIRRAGGENLRNESGRVAVTVGRGHTEKTANLVNETREELMAFLAFEAEHGAMADQTLALMAVEDLLHGDQHDPADLRVLAVCGMAGSGKTHLAATIIKNELARNPDDPHYSIRVAAPSNRAVAVLDARLRSLGVEDPRVLCTTAHKAFKSLEMTDVGAAVVKAIASDSAWAPVPAGADNYAVAEELIAEVLRNFNAQGDKKRQRVQELCRSAINVDDEGFAKILSKVGARALQVLGYPPLDDRFTFWSDTPEPANLFIIDEASMLGQSMIRKAADIAPTLLMGDSYQLPPVQLFSMDRYGGKHRDFPALGAVSARNTVTLQRSRRTADASLIPAVAAGALYLAPADIVRDLPLYTGEGELPEVCKIRSLDVLPSAILLGDTAAIVYANRKRVSHNRNLRKLMGRPVNAIVAGERLVIVDPAEGIRVKSGADASTINIPKDTLARVVDIQRQEKNGNAPQDFDDLYLFTLELIETGVVVVATLGYHDPSAKDGDKPPFLTGVERVTEVWDFNADLLIAFAASITAHKSQGSAFETVILDLNDMTSKHGRDELAKDEVPFEDGSYPQSWRRLCYTAATRATNRLIILTSL